MAKNPLLGTALKICAVVSSSLTTSATIKIEDPSGTAKVNNLAMTKELGEMYSYVYQSASTDTAGVYIVTITVNASSYSSVAQSTFTLDKQATASGA